MGHGVLGVYVNSSNMDEGALVKMDEIEFEK